MNSNNLLLAFFGCLAHFAIGTVAILGGNYGVLHFRYMVSLLEVNHGHICGGAVIGEQHILTAAHCFMNPDNSFKDKRVVALAGTNDLLMFTNPAVDREVVKIYVLHEYNATETDVTADIAILKLKEPLQITININLRQAKLERNQNRIYVGEKATIAGWGWNKFVYQNNQKVGIRTDSLLRVATADVMSYSDCQAEHLNLKIYAEHLCAKVEQRDHEVHGVCHGDDGGPLVHNGIVIGVLSKIPHDCSERTSPAIYTRTSRYLSFIRNAKEDKITRTMKYHILRP